MRNPIRKYDAIFFDLDGTLFDTAPDLAYAMNTLLDEHGHPPVRYPLFRNQVSRGSDAMIRHSFAIENNHPDFAHIKQSFLQTYAANLTRHTQLFPGIDQVLQRLDNQLIRWGIVTNKPEFLTTPLLTHFQMVERCCCIISGDTLSLKKPNPDPLLYACQLADCAPERALYIGDTESDILAARAAGMPAMAVTFGYYPRDSHPSTWHADVVVESAADIIKFLAL